MPREIISLQVGQCGNQIGWRFWDLALREHAQHAKEGLFDDAMSSLFRNVDTRYDTPRDIPPTVFENGAAYSQLAALRARAILIDTEEGVTNQVMKSPLGELFDPSQVITDVSGAGNNWAQGFCEYGPQHGEIIEDTVRRALEPCDSPQSFFVMHSLGGGTGSGLGTYIVRLLQDLYPELYRFTVSVFPSQNDDVITSPYNCVLALQQLSEAADCVLPLENQALSSIVQRVDDRCHFSSACTNTSQLSDISAPHLTQKHAPRSRHGDIRTAVTYVDYQTKQKKANKSKRQTRTFASETSDFSTQSANAFDSMNNIAAHMLSNLTASMRFEGTMNVDLNELTTNLVPFPKLHYLTSSLSPLYCLLNRQDEFTPIRIDQLFNDCLNPAHQLITAEPHSSPYLAMALLMRGDISVSDALRNVNKVKKRVKLAHWNTDGFKLGICQTPPLHQPYSLLSLSNNCCISDSFKQKRADFMQLYSVKAHLHHFQRYLSDDIHFTDALESLDDIIQQYDDVAYFASEPPLIPDPPPPPMPNMDGSIQIPTFEPPINKSDICSDWNAVGIMSRMHKLTVHSKNHR